MYVSIYYIINVYMCIHICAYMRSSREHVWHKGPSAAEEQGQNVLDALPSAAYKWQTGEYHAPTNVLASLPDDTQKWHKYTPEPSPLDQLPDDRYSWKGPGAQVYIYVYICIYVVCVCVCVCVCVSYVLYMYTHTHTHTHTHTRTHAHRRLIPWMRSTQNHTSGRGPDPRPSTRCSSLMISPTSGRATRQTNPLLTSCQTEHTPGEDLARLRPIRWINSTHRRTCGKVLARRRLTLWQSLTVRRTSGRATQATAKTCWIRSTKHRTCGKALGRRRPFSNVLTLLTLLLTRDTRNTHSPY